MKYRDFVVIGAGIVGLTIARLLKMQNPNAKVVVFEKEGLLGLHGSGRNSGVLHSGIYYAPDSLKAKICVSGSQKMARYCKDNNLPFNNMGKVIISTKPENDKQIDVLHARAIANNVNAKVIDREELRNIEPEANNRAEKALYSPTTSVIDPKSVLGFIHQEISELGVELIFGLQIKLVDSDASTIKTNHGEFKYGKLFNAAGQYSDKVAHLFGAGRRYTMIPFKGQYYALKNSENFTFNGLIYPVPDLNMPFLGVHSVKTINDEIYFGPSAVPALGRENYSGIEGIRLSESMDIALHLLKQFYYNKQGFRSYAYEEATRIFKRNFVKGVKALVPNIKSSSINMSSKVGIRAQLVDTQARELVTDFVVEHKDNATHILNAISPAFTCSFSFAEWVVGGDSTN